jgi:Tfp pilus assembly protein PilN
MIKINLSTAKKAIDLSNVGGFDLTRVKIKALLIVIALIYVPDFVLIPMWQEERQVMEQEVTSKQGELSNLKREISKSQELEKQIRELIAQEENLGKKLTAVKQAISEKRNPAPILLYIAKNIPKDLWIKDLDVDKESMIIKGEALDNISVGTFVNNLRSSIFIKDANIVGTSSVVREPDKRRIEVFEVKFSIARFNQ